MRYLQAYGSVFDGPHWRGNLLWCTLCHLIPVVGPIVFSGYCYELIELNSRQPSVPNPEFTFGRFQHYLLRGLWPFIIQLICQFLLQPPLMILSYGVILPAAIYAPRLGPSLGPLVFGLGIGGYLIVTLALAMALSLVLSPLLLRAGLSQDFAKAFDWRWILDFNRRVGLDLLLVMTFLFCTALPFIVVAYGTCGLGFFPLVTIMYLAGANLSWQLYNLYLARGGAPVPLQPLPTQPKPTPEPASLTSPEPAPA